LVLVDLLFAHKALVAESLMSGHWQMYSKELKNVECPRNQLQANLLLNSSTMEQMLNVIWPQLKVISCWHSSDAKPWAKKLQTLFSKAVLHPKGLFATEGVVTIPVDNQLHLAYQSHFYEFLTESGEVIPSWELAIDMRVSPIITTGGGLVRYRMFDWLKVVAKNDDIPILDFLGREATVDMVGEKMDFQSARDILNTLGNQAYCLIANFNELNSPYYAVLWESDRDGLFVDDVLDSQLNQFHHYKVARELGQLSPACRLEVKDVDKFIAKIKKRSGQVMGDQKLESIVRINTLEEFIRESV
jgi:hypothetical protein